MTMLADGEIQYVQGSGKKPYELKRINGVYSCSCPAWRNQSKPIDQRTCKHLTQYLGADHEAKRIGQDALPHVAGTLARVKPPTVILAHTWDGEQDLTGWYVSEKLDGVRGVWDGGRLLTRQGNVIQAPDWWKAGLPAAALDGELWMGRGLFQSTVSIVRSADAGAQWEGIRFLIFDLLDYSATLNFLHRQEILQAAKLGQYAHVLPHTKVTSMPALERALTRVIEAGGEGLMARHPGSVYEPGRTGMMLKLKRFTDAEATVLMAEEGKGRHKNRLGALVCSDGKGATFKVGGGFTDQQRDAWWSPDENARRLMWEGMVITYKHQGLTDGGSPRFPVFLRIFKHPGDPF